MLQKHQAQLLNTEEIFCIVSENFLCPSSSTKQLQKEQYSYNKTALKPTMDTRQDPQKVSLPKGDSQTFL